MLPCGKWDTVFKMPPAEASGPVRSDVRLFFSFYLKCPLACDICAGCYVGGREKKAKMKVSQSVFTFLNCSAFPFLLSPRGHFCLSVWQKQKQKKVLSLLHEKQITHLLNWETNANPFSGVSFEHSSSFSRSFLHSSNQANKSR